MTDAPKLYGVSTGDGNNGISHMFPDYYVRTNAPWRLAHLAALATFKPGFGQSWADSNVEIDGEAEYTIHAVAYNPPCEDTADGEYPPAWRCSECDASGVAETLPDDCPVCGDKESVSDDSENAEDGRNWSEHNGAWFLLDVFPVAAEDERDGVTIYDSIEGAFTPELIAAFPDKA